MKQIIRTRCKGRGFIDGKRRAYKFESLPVTFEDSGWNSVKEMQKELTRRFPDGIRNRKTRLIENGLIRVEGNRGNRETQVITLEN